MGGFRDFFATRIHGKKPDVENFPLSNKISREKWDFSRPFSKAFLEGMTDAEIPL